MAYCALPASISDYVYSCCAKRGSASDAKMHAKEQTLTDATVNTPFCIPCCRVVCQAVNQLRSIPILHTLMSAATEIELRNLIILRRPALPGSLLIRRPVFLAAGSDLLRE